MTYAIAHGDCRAVMAEMNERSVDAVVTDQHGGRMSLQKCLGVAGTTRGVTPKGYSSMLSQPSTSDLAAGTAAEHLVCADLLLAGYHAFRTDQLCSYDVAVEVEGRLVRVQVKSTRQPRAIPQRSVHIPAYLWHVRRSGKGGRRIYQVGTFDVLALVALDIRRVAYLPPSLQRMTIHIRQPDVAPLGLKTGKQFDDYSFDKTLAEVLG